MAKTASQLAYTNIPSLWGFSGGSEIGWILRCWQVSISDTQLKANEDGIDPGQHPDLIAHLIGKGIEIRLNQYGLIDTPRGGMWSLDRQF